MNGSKAYKNKLFSVLGDSISTLAGYTEPQEAAFYEGMRKFEADVFLPEDTWWGQVIADLGGTLLANNSISGSRVSRHAACEIPSYACSDERTAALGKNGLSPDVIMVFMGINDWGGGVPPTPRGEAAGDISVFSTAYSVMIAKLKKNYPNAALWCFTLPVSKCSRMENFEFPFSICGRHIEEYCAVIRMCAKNHGCRIIDLYTSAEPYETIDGFHPSAEGMETLSANVLALL